MSAPFLDTKAEDRQTLLSKRSNATRYLGTELLTVIVLVVGLGLTPSLFSAPSEAGQSWRLVFGESNQVQALEGQLMLDQLQPGLTHVWGWSEQVAPVRIEAGELPEVALDETHQRLEVRIKGWGERPLAAARLIAAPSEMWNEVSEDLLPHWPIDREGRALVPLDPGLPWRLRLTGQGLGSWWIDLSAGTRKVLIRPLPADDLQLEVDTGDGQTPAWCDVSLLTGHPGHGAQQRIAWQYAPGTRLVLAAVPDQQELSVMLSCKGYLPAAHYGFPSSMPDRWQLQRGRAVSGRLVTRTTPDEPVRPLPGAKIKLTGWLSADHPSLWVSRSESDDSGRWLIDTAPLTEAAVSASSPGLVPYQAQIAAGTEPVTLGTIELIPGVTMTVRVIDDLGQAVAGARLEAWPLAAVHTDSTGLARLENVAPGAILVQATAAGHIATEQRLTPLAEAPVELRLERATVIRGRLLDPDGVPVGSGRITVTNQNRSVGQSLQPGGRFTVELTAGRSFQASLSSPTTRTLKIEIAPGRPGEERDLGDLHAPTGLTISGRVLSWEDGAPVSGARVWLPRPSAAGPISSWASGDLLVATSDADGRFQLTGLPPATVLLRVDATGLARLHRSVDPDPEQAQLDLGDLELKRGTRLLIEVDQEASGDHSQARVDLRGQWHELDMLTAPVVGGSARVANVPAGRVTVSVVREWRLVCEQEVEIADGEDELEVECQAQSMTVSGLVRVAGTAPGSGKLMWMPPGVGVAGVIKSFTQRGGLRQQHPFGIGRSQVDVAVGDDGYFSSTDLRPGPWQVYWVPDQGSMSEMRQVELPKTEEYEISFDFAGGTVRGVVSDEEGEPVAGARVSELQSRVLAFSAADGSFTLSNLKPGQCYIQARLGSKTSEVAELELAADAVTDPLHLVLGEDREQRIRLSVLDQAEQPLAGAFVFVERDQGHQSIVTTAADGRAEVLMTPPYPQQLRCAAFADGSWSFSSWRSFETATVDPMTLVLGATGSLQVVSKELAGSPAIRRTDGWQISSLLTTIGLRPSLEPARPLIINGLPEGQYQVTLGGVSGTVRVRRDQQVELALE